MKWEVKLRNRLAQNSDVNFRSIVANNETLVIVYIAGLVDDVYVQEQIIPSLFHETTFNTLQAYRFEQLEEAIEAIFYGHTLVITQRNELAYPFPGKGLEKRSIEEPSSENTVRGPRDGFVESITTNLSLIRRRYPDTSLQVRTSKIGARTRTQVALVYIDGIVNPETLEEVKERVDSIQIDEVLDSGTIEQWIEDSWYSPFPQVQYTEQPVRAVSALSEGRIAIVVDGSPIVLLVPVTFAMLFQAMDDYSERWMVGTAIRFIRMIAAVIALVLPSLYIALLSYHPGMVPTQLTLSIAATRAEVPFPTIMEALLMETTLEMLREAGLRLPRFIGQTIGIVGGLVIGQAAVEAGIVSPIMVIVVALTAICSFLIPAYNGAIAIRLLRFPLMILVGVLGLLGLILGVLIIVAHLVSLKSFGINYFSPFAPYHGKDWKDTVIRAPLPLLETRPSVLQPLKKKRLWRDKRKKGW
ncbi:spore germination protein [Paenibacillus doosanensis]|uniref:spore germination protein n=1 Tax=Paenibacillus doosanensis TaxID=1229154 RepID=UPI00217FFD8B|nr:spore germination protein [Paenibacillus doosanensis]MCS7461559.1 spore germination protein [Paenibacillus doosanensis]